MTDTSNTSNDKPLDNISTSKNPQKSSKEANFFCIPEIIMHHPQLQPIDCLLWGRIHAMQNLDNGCFATAKYFCQLLNITERYYYMILKKLRALGLLKKEKKDKKKFIWICALPDLKEKTDMNHSSVKQDLKKIPTCTAVQSTHEPQFMSDMNHSSVVDKNIDKNRERSDARTREASPDSATSATFDSILVNKKLEQKLPEKHPQANSLFALIETNKLRVRDFIFERWLDKFGYDKVERNIISIIRTYNSKVNSENPIRNHESYIEDALKKDTALKQTNAESNKQFAINLKDQHNLQDLELLQNYCRDKRKLGSDLHYHMSINSFREIMERRFLTEIGLESIKM